MDEYIHNLKIYFGDSKIQVIIAKGVKVTKMKTDKPLDI